MFQLYQHHDLTRLAETLAVLRARNRPASPLEADTVLVPNRGTARWLQAELAESEGTATHLHLPVPGLFVWQVLRDTVPGGARPDSSDYERERLVWHLYALLPELDIPAVQRYLAGEPRERHRYQLAQQLADVFDQYLIHRRDVLAAWEAGREERFPPASWQAPVWRAVVERVGREHRAQLLSDCLAAAADGRLVLERVPRTIYAFALADLPADYLRVLYALGQHVDVHFLLPNPSAAYWGDVERRRVARVSEPVDARIARRGNGEEADDVGAGAGQGAPTGAPRTARAGEAEGGRVARRPDDDGENGGGPEGEPGAHHAGSAAGDPGSRFAASGLVDADVEAGHPLLASLGRAGRDFLRVLYADEFAGIREPLSEALAYEPPGTDTLLHRVQSGVIEGIAEPVDVGTADASIQVHACHGSVREMQVLHDRLLDRFSDDPAIQPRDVLVLVPDMARYAPAIHGVFGAATGARHIPYSLADRPRLDTHPIAQTFRQLIELPLSRWTASEVLGLAGVPAVMRRFGLDESDLELLQQWIAAAGVRWGLDRGTREAAGAAAFEQNTWRFGLDRLLLGLAQNDAAGLVDGVAPWNDLEGGAAAAVGRLWLLVDRLRRWRDALVANAPASTWQERLNAMVGELFRVEADDAEEQAALETVFDATAVLEEAARSLGDEALSWEAVREALLGALAGASQRQPLVTGSVTFSGLEPLRGVPFDVIAMVGLDDGVFPRQDGSREFNLLQQRPRTGDPGVRDADRMAFLQALMAARKCFHVSYTGRDVSDGAELQPSPVVGEFLDFLHGQCFADHTRDAFRAALVLEQPMHPYSPRCFGTDDPRLFTFAGDWQQAAEAHAGERREPAAFLDGTELERPDAAQPIELGDLQRFFRHPPRWFFRERLRLDLDEAPAAIEDDEPLDLDGLARHTLRERLFRDAVAEASEAIAEEPGPLERARGELPPPPLGGREFAAAAADVNAILAVQRRWAAESTDNDDLDVDLVLDDGTRVIGRIPDVGPAELRRLRPGQLRLSHRLHWWLEYLVVAAGGHERGLRVAGAKDGETEERVANVAPATARMLLATAIAHYRDGLGRPLPFEPQVADRYLEELAKRSQATKQSKTPDEALDATNRWLTNPQNPAWPMDDAHFRAVLAAGAHPLGERAADAAFVRVADDVAQPLRDHLAETDE